MHKKKRCGFQFCTRRGMFFVAVMLIVTSVSCQPLRKKFTRRKKAEEKNKFVPVLDPVDYAPRNVSAQEKYAYHYSLWQVWHKDLLVTINDGGSGKKQKYLLAQSIATLSEMQEWIVGEKRVELESYIEALLKVQKEYERPSSMRDMYRVRKRLEHSAKQIRNNLSSKLPLTYKEIN